MTVTLIEAVDPTPTRVLIAGGGIAAAEALIALRKTAPAHVDVELIAPQSAFTYRPLSVAEPFGLVQPHELDLEDLARGHDARFRRDALAAIVPDRRVVLLRSGAELPYDSLLVATGARSEVTLRGALTFRGPRDVPAFRHLLAEVESGAVKRLAFAVPARVQWSLPLYELALMTAAHAAARRLELRIEFATPEARPLALFGPRVSDRLAQLLGDADIALTVNAMPVAVGPGHLMLASRAAIATDRVVTLGRLRVDPIPGLPQGPRGFVATNSFGRVEGLEDVYAVGDATWYPVKQGGLATQQADAAASAIAAGAGAPVTAKPFSPVLRGVLLTGGAPQYLRGEERRPAGGVSGSPLWSPVAKVAGRYLGPYLAARGGAAGTPFGDLPIRRRVAAAAEHSAALELALEAADASAAWRDMRGALRWLRVAEGLNVVLPPEYAAKRGEWRHAERLASATEQVLAEARVGIGAA